MRGLIWIVLLFAAAVVVATTFGRNDALVSIFWGGTRVDLSLNLFLLAVAGGSLLLVLGAHATQRLLSLPRRAAEWRALRRERAAHAALREALLELYSARYSRAGKAARRALALQADVPALADQADFTVLALMLAAANAHRLQDRGGRDGFLEQALATARRAAMGRGTEDAVHLASAAWTMDDRDPERAQQALAALTPGAARRTQALRLRLQASRATRLPLQALHLARLLAHHQAFSPVVAQGLLRALAAEALDEAYDIDQLRRIWAQFDQADRRDPYVAARAAHCASALGAAHEARRWLRPFWERLGDLESGERMVVALALVDAAAGIESDWLPTLESAAQAYGDEAAVLAAVGEAFAASGLYGKARQLLEPAAAAADLPARARRAAWRRLAALAREESDEARAIECEREAAAID